MSAVFPFSFSPFDETILDCICFGKYKLSSDGILKYMNHIKEKNSLNSNEGFVVALATNNLMEFDSAAAIFVSVVDIEKTTVKEIKFLGNEKHGQFLFILSEEIKIKDLKDCEMKLVFENSLFDYKIWDSINPTVDFSDSTIRTSSIITGKDCRTTCMIRNIPNKYNQQMLLDVINESHFGNFDFLYLRIDFKNKCNVGYAFINFVHPNVMLEDPSFRPKLFHTDGILAGLEEEFPIDLMINTETGCTNALEGSSRHSTEKKTENNCSPSKGARRSHAATSKEDFLSECLHENANFDESNGGNNIPFLAAAGLSPEKRTISRPPSSQSRKSFAI